MTRPGTVAGRRRCDGRFVGHSSLQQPPAEAVQAAAQAVQEGAALPALDEGSAGHPALKLTSEGPFTDLVGTQHPVAALGMALNEQQPTSAVSLCLLLNLSDDGTVLAAGLSLQQGV